MFGMDDLSLYLFNGIKKIKIIDAHEHLPAERVRVAKNVDALTLFSHYVVCDLSAAGMADDEIKYLFTDAPLDERFVKFEPHYENVCNTAYVKAAHVSLEHFYGERRLTKDNVHAVSEKMKAANKPGIYEKILRGECNIEACVNDGIREDSEASPDGLLRPVHRAPNPVSADALKKIAAIIGRPVNKTGDIVEAGAAFAKGLRAKGCVGMKMMVFRMKKPDAAAANDALAALLKDESAILGSSNPLNDIFYDAIFAEMARQELPVSVHTGSWGDFRDLNPEHAIYMSDNYPDVKFDLFHLGYPYSREAIVMGKLRRNIWLNLCWTQIISPYFTTQALIEILEAIPSNKIIGFGGDYMVVEKVYGHLQLALSVIAKALAAKINDGFLSCDAAARLAEKMLYDNPKALYQL